MSDAVFISPESLVDHLLGEETLPTSKPADCPYLPGRAAKSEGFYLTDRMDGDVYRVLMDRGFRRSGRVFYRPCCESCNLCIAYRVPVAAFHRTRDMRRVWNRNGDVRVETGAPEATDRKHALYRRYLDAQHDGTMTGTRQEFDRFLYSDVVPSIEFRYYLGRRLIGVSLADVCGDALSSVYMFFEPSERRRSLGTYSALWEIEYCRRSGLAYYYLGYYVPGSKTMAYKARFRPGQVLDADGQWTPMTEHTPA